MDRFRLTGLVAAAHTPFTDAGDLNPAAVERQCAHLLANGVTTVFINGSTGESQSTGVEERRTIAERWLHVARGTAMRVVVHVGSNCLTDAQGLAAHAQASGAAAIAMFAPSYYKPRSVADLVACCARVAAAAPELPFYFYDIPALTGVLLPMDEFLEQAAPCIPRLAGIKFTNPDLLQFQLCLRHQDGRFDIPWGNDEHLLAAYALGATGAVGSTFNFAPGIYRRAMAAFDAGDLTTARKEQFRSVLLVKTLAKRGYLGASKALMRHLGVDVGPARLPLGNPDGGQIRDMIRDLETIGYSTWWR